MTMKRLILIILLLLISLLTLSSCYQGEWPIGKDTVSYWKNGKVQIQRAPDHSYVLVVDHKDIVLDINTYVYNNGNIYMRYGQKVFLVFNIDDELLNTYFGLESISDPEIRSFFSDMIEAQETKR